MALMKPYRNISLKLILRQGHRKRTVCHIVASDDFGNGDDDYDDDVEVDDDDDGTDEDIDVDFVSGIVSMSTAPE